MSTATQSLTLEDKTARNQKTHPNLLTEKSFQNPCLRESIVYFRENFMKHQPSGNSQRVIAFPELRCTWGESIIRTFRSGGTEFQLHLRYNRLKSTQIGQLKFSPDQSQTKVLKQPAHCSHMALKAG